MIRTADLTLLQFPTEVILEHSDAQDSITASIIPHPCRLDVSKCQLRSFHATITDYSELPGVIGAAGELMGLRGYGGNKDGPVFVGDVLRIKVVGRTGLHLSIVDLPGLISTASEEQTQADVDIVHRMVDAYIEKPRTIILAIVQASNDIANQSIIRKSKDFDKAGQRTVGVITKPDLINKGTEGRIALLAKNQDTTKLQLGFFILKNPTPSEMKAQITPKQRSANELQFFSAWKEHGLDPGRVGIDKLRDSLQHLLDQHIERELPKVRAEITSMIKSTEQDLINLPKERHTVADLRVYLSGLAMQYHGLVEAALDGNYNTAHASFFTAQGQAISQARLRAVVHKANTEFSTHMRQRGRVFTLTSDRSKIKIRHGQAGELTDFDVGDGFDTVYVDEELMKTWVRQVGSLHWILCDHRTLTPCSQIYQTTRGRELPGNYSHVLLTELFHCQSQRWAQLAEDHVDAVADHIEVFVTQAMYYVNMEDHVRVEMLEGIHVKLQEYKRKAKEELAQLREDELGQPITYNRKLRLMPCVWARYSRNQYHGARS